MAAVRVAIGRQQRFHHDHSSKSLRIFYDLEFLNLFVVPEIYDEPAPRGRALNKWGKQW